jgi:hypothetical protein
MAITVQYSPDAQLVAKAAMTSGAGDYNRFAQQQQLARDELNQRRDLTMLQVADGQYQQKLGILDGQYRQTQQIAASQTEQLRNLAQQTAMAQYDAGNQNWRFGVGIANDRSMQDQRLAVGLQQQQNDISSTEYRQQQQLAQQNLSDMRNIQAQNQRTAMSLQMERQNTLMQLQARQQSERFQAQQQYGMAMLDGQQKAGLMGLNAQLDAKQQAADQANRIEQLNLSKKNQLDLSSTLADKEFRQTNFLDEYGKYYDSMAQREYETRWGGFNAKMDAANKWLDQTGMKDDPNVRAQIEWQLTNEAMGIKARAPIYSDAEWKFKNGLVEYKGEKFMATDRGFEALPNPNARMEEVRLRGVNEAVSTSMKMAYDRSNAVYESLMQQAASATIPPGVNPAAFQAEMRLQALQKSREAYTTTMREAIEWTTGVTGTSVADVAGM